MVKKTSTAALLMALAVVSLVIAGASTVTIALLFLASMVTCVAIIECGVKYSILTFLGASIISALIIPKKSLVYAYIFFFGYYPIIKLYVEKIKKMPLEWLLKILIFNVILVVAYIIFELFFVSSLNSEIVKFILTHLSLIIVTLEVIFVLYDVLMSYVITFYQRRIKPMINK